MITLPLRRVRCPLLPRTLPRELFAKAWLALLLAGAVVLGADLSPAQAQTFDYGDLPGGASYDTTGASAAQHQSVTGTHLGAALDTESNGFPSVGADGDDLNATDDEDGVGFSDFVKGESACVDINSSTAAVCGTKECIGKDKCKDNSKIGRNECPIGAGTFCTITCDGESACSGNAKFKPKSEGGLIICNGKDACKDSRIQLGSSADPSQWKIKCTGEKACEDMNFGGVSQCSGSACPSCAGAAGGGGFLNAWMDWNGDGSFTAGEQPISDYALDTDGVTQICGIDVPAGAVDTVYARFRMSSDNPGGSLSYNGSWSNGEVEDYAIAVTSNGECGDGTVDPGEACDVGPDVSGDCCTSTCQLESLGTTCRDSAGVCDVAETCSGADAACPADELASSAVTCRVSAGVCDVAETCSGADAACPVDGYQAAGTTCRVQAGVCDVVEACTGADAACPADGLASSAVTCRVSAGACDVAEMCSGSDVACPADGLASSAVTCRASAGVCDVAETCSGSDAACPADELASSAVTCRVSAGVCDVAETCSGADAACPSDEFASAATTCGDAETECTNQDTCNGSGQCSDNGFKMVGTACGDGSDTGCDNPDSCDGTGTCLANYEPAATACGDDGTECRKQDLCDGGGHCSDNGFMAAGTSCGDDGTECTNQDTCNGSGQCADNGFKLSGTACGDGSDTACDNPDSCNGTGSCLANYESSATACGDNGTECTNQDFCDGGGFCSDNGFMAAGTSCGDDGAECTNQDTCNGSGQCSDNGFKLVGTACGDAGDQCNLSDGCNASGSCVDGGFVPDGSVCSDDNPMTFSDQCNAGTCAGEVAAPVPAASLPLRVVLVAALLVSGWALRRFGWDPVRTG